MINLLLNKTASLDISYINYVYSVRNLILMLNVIKYRNKIFGIVFKAACW